MIHVVGQYFHLHTLKQSQKNNYPSFGLTLMSNKDEFCFDVTRVISWVQLGISDSKLKAEVDYSNDRP